MSVDIQTLLRSPKAYDLTRQAIEAMEANNVWPTVRNFESVGALCRRRKGRAVAAEIDRLIASGEPITESVGEALAAQYLPEARLNGDIMEAGDALSKELSSVSKAIESAESSEVYGQQLAERLPNPWKPRGLNQVKAVIQTL